MRPIINRLAALVEGVAVASSQERKLMQCTWCRAVICRTQLTSLYCANPPTENLCSQTWPESPAPPSTRVWQVPQQMILVPNRSRVHECNRSRAHECNRSRAHECNRSRAHECNWSRAHECKGIKLALAFSAFFFHNPSWVTGRK